MRKGIAPMPICDLERQTELAKHVCALCISWQFPFNILQFEKGGLLKI
jgi:hypothetical protein